MNSILLLEDDHHLSSALSRLLESRLHCLPAIAPSLKDAYQLLEKHQFDVVVIDRMLGDGDGLEVVSFLNEYHFDTKVLVLTSKNQISEREEGLVQGADDYLGKPLSAREFTLRIEKLLRISKHRQAQFLQVNDIQLYPTTGQLTIGKASKVLRKKEAQILACLIRNKNAVVTRDMLIDSVWQSDDDIPTYSTIDVYLRRVRMQLGRRKNSLETVRGFGYLLREH